MKKVFLIVFGCPARGLRLDGGGISAVRSLPSARIRGLCKNTRSCRAWAGTASRRHGSLRLPSVNALAIDLAGEKIGELARESGVQYVELDPVREPLGLAQSQLTPSLSNGLYGLITTRAVDAHALSATGAGVKACVADTGLDTRHPDIAPNFAGGFDAFGGGTVDVFDDGVAATETHGTHVAGTVLAADNRVGVLGVAYDADLYHARVLGTQADGSVSGTTSQVMEGVQWLADQGCKVVNMSLGGGSPSRTEEKLYKQLYANGTLIVAAAGNDGRNRLSFPGGYETVLSVAAVDASNTIASFSNTGKGLDLVGPGVTASRRFRMGSDRKRPSRPEEIAIAPSEWSLLGVQALPDSRTRSSTVASAR